MMWQHKEHPICSLKMNHRSSHLYFLVNHFKNDLISVFIQRAITVELKTNENASESSDQDPTDGVSRVTFKGCDVMKSRQFICDPMATTSP